jgi:hypothetical protein
LAAQEDVDAVTRCFQDHGLRAESVAPGRRTIELSGRVRHVEEVFRTEVHHYLVDGRTPPHHSIDIAIPDALAGWSVCVASLHDFHLRPLHRRSAPDADHSTGRHVIGTYDFATIYNLITLWNSNLDGSGQSIAIAGRTNIDPRDIAGFRIDVPADQQHPGHPQRQRPRHHQRGPGDRSGSESGLDLEWAGAATKGATIKLVVSASTNASDGIHLSGVYIVNHNLAPVVSLSFGACEAANGRANQFFSNLWSQAAAQGMSRIRCGGRQRLGRRDDPAMARPGGRMPRSRPATDWP